MMIEKYEIKIFRENNYLPRFFYRKSLFKIVFEQYFFNCQLISIRMQHDLGQVQNTMIRD